jgi:hypothetical protein
MVAIFLAQEVVSAFNIKRSVCGPCDFGSDI